MAKNVNVENNIGKIFFDGYWLNYCVRNEKKLNKWFDLKLSNILCGGWINGCKICCKYQLEDIW